MTDFIPRDVCEAVDELLETAISKAAELLGVTDVSERTIHFLAWNVANDLLLGDDDDDDPDDDPDDEDDGNECLYPLRQTKLRIVR